MSFEQFFTERILNRLEHAPAIVMYDEAKRYRNIVLSLGSDTIAVIDAQGPILQLREKALQNWFELTKDETKRLVIYVPKAKPVTQEEEFVDPFLPFRVGGAVFPDGAGDEYKALARGAFPDHTGKIEEYFATGEPDFATLNNLTTGTVWPKLRTVLKAESAKEIICALLDENGPSASESISSWRGELQQFLVSVLSYSLPEVADTIETVREHLWSYVLFSEFVLDLPGELPERIADIPHSSEREQELIYSVCDHIRESTNLRAQYVIRATELEKRYALPERMKGVTELGRRETFPFENIVSFQEFLSALQEHNLADIHRIIEKNKTSIWRSEGENHGEIWNIAETAYSLLLELSDNREYIRQLKDTGLDEIINLYSERFYKPDTLYRHYQHARSRLTQDSFFGIPLTSIDDVVEKQYADFIRILHTTFMHSIQQEGWPSSAYRSQREIAEKDVISVSKKNGKVAYILVDALRYELGVELENKFASQYTATVSPACSQLPSITLVGMASLQPRAKEGLKVNESENGITVSIDSTDVSTAAQRDKYLQKYFGDRIFVDRLDQFNKKTKIEAKLKDKDLLVLRSQEIDTVGESQPAYLATLIPTLLNQILKAVYKAVRAGFTTVVLAADHGFCLLPEQTPGDIVPIPQGEWSVKKGRFLLGEGSGNEGTVVFDTNSIGIPTDIRTFATPKNLTTFKEKASVGNIFLHGGISLQELIIPVVVITAKESKQKKKALPTISISYRDKKKADVPSQSIKVVLENMEAPALEFEEDSVVEVLNVEVAVHDDQNQEVGRILPSRHFDPSTNSVKIQPGEKLNIRILMNDDFRGQFTVKARDPVTGVLYDKVELETKYTE